jgi:hypothetical protein
MHSLRHANAESILQGTRSRLKGQPFIAIGKPAARYDPDIFRPWRPNAFGLADFATFAQPNFGQTP